MTPEQIDAARVAAVIAYARQEVAAHDTDACNTECDSPYCSARCAECVKVGEWRRVLRLLGVAT